jgi:hypothetical protein
MTSNHERPPNSRNVAEQVSRGLHLYAESPAMRGAEFGTRPPPTDHNGGDARVLDVEAGSLTVTEAEVLSATLPVKVWWCRVLVA